MNMKKHFKSARRAYIAAIIFAVLGVIGYIVRAVASQGTGIPTGIFDGILGLGMLLLSTGIFDLPTTIPMFLVLGRKSMLFIALILMIIQAWLKHDEGIALTLANVFAFPTEKGMPPSPNPRPVPRPEPNPVPSPKPEPRPQPKPTPEPKSTYTKGMGPMDEL